ncbi:hypothetical protein [Ferruginibacter sp. SUN106]|uniref:hypothetical protein n=1 Tax=Ferruginibacter sp. SUN106 TaxID=2978348 RepID=UPI003D36E3DC
MKYSIIITVLVVFISCNQSTGNNKVLQNRIDSLEKKLADTYKPGFGEFMSSIQVHHAKLWFAGQNKNWALADFEIHEIMEAVENIQKYQAERKESEKVIMINPALDSVNAAITKQDPVQFRNSYVLLTNTCNNCHHAVNFEFNVVTIPDKPPFSNQVFTIEKAK